MSTSPDYGYGTSNYGHSTLSEYDSGGTELHAVPDTNPAPDTTYEAAEAAGAGPTDVAESPKDDTDGSAGGSKTKDKKSRGRSAREERVYVRRIATKTVEIAGASDEQRTVLAAILGCKDNVVTLATTVMTAERGSTKVVDDVRELLSAESDLQRGVQAMALATEGRLKAAWTILKHLGAVDVDLPANDAKAAMSAAEHLQGLEAPMVTDALDAVLELSKRW